MPARAALTSSFHVDEKRDEEVLCPLTNQDGSVCRKRCAGPKRFRSMQEHIRRAHEDHYIPKLPATEESFLLMISTQPNKNKQKSVSSSQETEVPSKQSYDYGRYDTNRSRHPGSRNDDGKWTKTHAAMFLAGMRDDGDNERIQLPPLSSLQADNVTSEPYHPSESTTNGSRLFPSPFAHSPPGRSLTLPPSRGPLGPNRNRKASITKRGHNKKGSRGTSGEWVKRLHDERLHRVAEHDRKAYSVEPPTYAPTSPWEALVYAASEAGDLADRTPLPQSPVSAPRGSVPPVSNQVPQPHSYQASPLQQALTPPSYNQDLEPFPSVESGESGENFHISSHGLPDSSPPFAAQAPQIYCAACKNVAWLKESYACTECICGLCPKCVAILAKEPGMRKQCPICAHMSQFKPIQLDVR